MSKTRYRCLRCGRVTHGRIPPDGSAASTVRFPSMHYTDGQLCPGMFEAAEVVTVGQLSEEHSDGVIQLVLIGK